jgi:hypothetical protein
MCRKWRTNVGERRGHARLERVHDGKHTGVHVALDGARGNEADKTEEEESEEGRGLRELHDEEIWEVAGCR